MPDVVLFTGVDPLHPDDAALARLGGTIEGFGLAVSKDNFYGAEQLLDQIEDRVLQLKREKAAILTAALVEELRERYRSGSLAVP